MNKFSLSKREEDWKKSIITPRVAATGIVESPDRKSIILIKRKYPPYGYACPGGMIEVGETVEQAVKREVLEETGIEADVISLFGVHSSPFADPRWHVVIIYALMRAQSDKDPKGGDDALEAFWHPYNSDKHFDKIVNSSKIILNDYREWREKEEK